MAGHVYILGAGFSVPLGGPLFSQLLTKEMEWASSDVPIPDDLKTSICSLCLDPSEKRRHKWRSIDKVLARVEPLDAEELLAVIDEASRGLSGKRAEAISRACFGQSTGDFKRLLRYLKLVVASQANAFVDEIDEYGEAIAPYKKWVSLLEPGDSIVTFNYDLLVEKLATQAGIELSIGPNALKKGCTRLYKLHGSVNWAFDSLRNVGVFDDTIEAERDLAIGMPGRGKAELLDSASFDFAWSAASRAIKNAKTISIIGYSMPMSDNYAKDMILSSLSTGSLDQFNLVLGPSSGTQASCRMRSMIQPLVPSVRVSDIPMGAQDFLAHVHSYRTFAF